MLLLFPGVEWSTQGISGTDGKTHNSSNPVLLEVQLVPLSLLVFFLLTGSWSSTTDRKIRKRIGLARMNLLCFAYFSFLFLLYFPYIFYSFCLSVPPFLLFIKTKDKIATIPTPFSPTGPNTYITPHNFSVELHLSPPWPSETSGLYLRSLYSLWSK